MSASKRAPQTLPHQDTWVNMETLKELQSYIQEEKKDAVISSQIEHKELTITVRQEELIPTLTWLRDAEKCQFKILIDLCGVDWLGKPDRAKNRFDVVYHLLSIKNNQRLRVKVEVKEGESIPTSTKVFSCANWFERECYDMFGIPFADHPDLRRILTDYGFTDFPLRKDFPLEGKVEVYYDEAQKRVAYKPVDLPQQFRHFDKQSSWKAMTGNAHLAEADNVFDAEEFK